MDTAHLRDGELLPSRYSLVDRRMAEFRDLPLECAEIRVARLRRDEAQHPERRNQLPVFVAQILGPGFAIVCGEPKKKRSPLTTWSGRGNHRWA